MFCYHSPSSFFAVFLSLDPEQLFYVLSNVDMIYTEICLGCVLYQIYDFTMFYSEICLGCVLRMGVLIV